MALIIACPKSVQQALVVFIRQSTVAQGWSDYPTISNVISSTRWGPGPIQARSDIRQRPDLGAKHHEFYTEKYLETRSEGKAVGRYRKLLAQPAPSTAESGVESGPAQCELVHIAGPDVHTIETLQNVVGPRAYAA